ncbi:hypothetical protein M758_9G188900 [Ceratodon purpureus]|nr:hypothetical protein KC19_9G191400 [Ceratodon purpureus]KAG0607048.1 hypothetical protein M758_9G188900 [Ceratodon purpureus]
MAPSPPSSRRRARRSLRRSSARDDLEEYLTGLENDDHATGLEDDLDLDVALALSFSIAEQNAIAHDTLGTPHLSVIANMTYESLVQLENVRCVASATVVAALPVCCFEKEQAAGFDQASEVCVICQGDYEPGDSQVKLPCQHAFHQACGAEWLLNYSKLCPVCKHDITDAATMASSSV